MAFDLQGARADGYSDQEIADYLSQEKGFDASGARNDGYGDGEIINYLVGTVAAPEEPGFIDRTGEIIGQGFGQFVGSSAEGLSGVLGYLDVLPETQKDLTGFAEEVKEEAKKDAVAPIKPLQEAESFGDVASSAFEYLAQSTPHMATMLGGAYAGGKAGAKLGLLLGPKGSAVFGVLGSILGGGIATYNSFLGNNIEEAERVKGRKLTESEMEGSMLAAAGQSVADALISRLLPAKGSATAMKNILNKGIKGATVEGTTEVFQETLAILQANDFNLDSLKTPEAQFRLTEATLAGISIGGPIGAVTGPFTTTPAPIEAPELADPGEGLPDVTEETVTEAAPTDQQPLRLAPPRDENDRTTARSPEEVVADVLADPVAVPTEGIVVDQETFQIKTTDGHVLTPRFKSLGEAVEARQRLIEGIDEKREDLFAEDQSAKVNEAVKSQERAGVPTLEEIQVGVAGVAAQQLAPDVTPIVSRETDPTLQQTQQVEAMAGEPAPQETVDRVVEVARERNIDVEHPSFSLFAERVTGLPFDPTQQTDVLTVRQANNLVKAVDRVNDGVAFDEVTRIPLENMGTYGRDQLVRARNRLRQGKVTDDGKIDIFSTTRKNRKGDDISVRDSTRAKVDKEIAEAAQINTFFPEGERDVISIRNRLVDEGVIEGIGKPDKTGTYKKYRRPRRVEFKTWEQRDLNERRQSMSDQLDRSFAETDMRIRSPESITRQVEQSVPDPMVSPKIMQKIRQNLEKRLRARGISDNVALVIADTTVGVEGIQSQGEGVFVQQNDAGKRAIIVALDTLPMDTLKKPKELARHLAGVMDHETVHALVDLGVITDADLAVLGRAAEVTPHWSGQTDTDGNPISVAQDIANRYNDLNAEEQLEEAAAELFRGHASGMSPLRGRPLSLWNKIVGFFKDIKGVFSEQKQYDAAQLFNRASQADITAAVAPARGAAGRAEDFDPAILETAPKESRLQAGVANRLLPNGNHPSIVSSRYPTNVRATEDPLTETLTVNLEAMKQNPTAFAYNMDLVKEYPGFNTEAVDPDDIAADFIQFAEDNLRFLYNQVPADIRERSKLWYDGANALSIRLAEQFGLSGESVAAVMASLSPQKDWFQNASLGERLIDIHETQTREGNERFVPDRKMKATLRKIFGTDRHKENLKAMINKPYQDLTDPVHKAMWIRAWDETFNPREYRTLTPEGNWVGEATGKTGWGSIPEIRKAVQALEVTSEEDLIPLLGNKNKVRSFYNNILAPNSEFKDVTIDTHAVAAALLRALSGGSREVHHNFGTSPEKPKQPENWRAAKNNKDTGAYGMYGLYADAYRSLAQKLGIEPRELQSITWEAVRGLFPATFKKQKANVVSVDQVWERVDNGELTIEEAQDQILAIRDGIENPAWTDTGDRSNQERGVSSYDGELVEFRIPRRSAGELATGTRDPVGVGRDGFLDTVEVDKYSGELRVLENKKAKESRTQTRIPDSAYAFMTRRDEAGNPTTSFGKVRVGGKDFDVRLARGYEGAFGMEHAAEHDPEFEAFTPFANSREAFVALMDTYWNSKTNAPSRNQYIKLTDRPGGVDLTWTRPDFKYPIRLGLRKLSDIYAVNTIFPKVNKMRFAKDGTSEGPVIQMKKQGDYNLEAISPAARQAAIESFRKSIESKKDPDLPKMSRPVVGGKPFSFANPSEDMGTDKRMMVTPRSPDETMGGKVLRRLGLLGDTPLDSYGQFFRWFRHTVVDSWDPARYTEVGLSKKDAKYMNFLSANNSAWAALRSARRGTSITANALLKGIPIYKDGWSRVSNIPENATQTNIDGTVEASAIAGQEVGLIPIIEGLREGTKDKGGHRFESFHEYAIARRAARLLRENREIVLTEKEIIQNLAMGHTATEIAVIMNPKAGEKGKTYTEAQIRQILGGKDITLNSDFDQIFMNYQVWNKGFVQFLVDTGMIDQKMADSWTNSADYIPFYRQLDSKERAIGEPDFFSGVSSKPPPPLKGKGQVWTVVTKRIVDGELVETRVPRTFQGTNPGRKEAQAYANSLQSENANVEGFDTKVIKTGMPIGGFLDTVVENANTAVQTGMMNVGVQRAMRNLVLSDNENTFRIKTPPPGQLPKGAITFRVNGEPVTMNVGDPALYSSFLNLNWNMHPTFQLLGMPARFLREMITRSPEFMARNMLRDSLSAWATSGRSITPLVSTVTGFANATRGDKSSDALAAAGIMTGYDYGGNINDMSKFIEKELRKYQYPSEVGRAIRNPFKYIWDATGTASRNSDAATRIAVYNRVLKDTGDEGQATWEAAEVINFSARGNSKVIQTFSALIPFLNARFQGIDVMYRASIGAKDYTPRTDSKRVKQMFLMRGLMLAASSALYWAMVHDDDDYKNQSAVIKDNYWIIPSSAIPGYDGDPLRIPIPFEVGLLFKTMPERIMAQFYGDDVPKDLTDSITRGITSTLAINPVPQFALPALETMANYSVFTGRPVVSTSQERLEPGYQYNSGTSELAKDLGRRFNYSPLEIDHMVKGYGGTIGTYALNLVDEVWRQTASDMGERPERRVTEYPVIKGFFARKNARGLADQFYDLQKMTRQAMATVKMLEDQDPTGKKADSLAMERMRLMEIEGTLNSIEQNLNELRNERRFIQNDPKISAADKRMLIDDIAKDELLAVSEIPELRKGAVQVFR